ncbi:MAG: type VII secretion protein EssC, partial [Anaerolineae bacterium]|nr:type VII secretion protein EssC [Anaerolineae bacterium]
NWETSLQPDSADWLQVTLGAIPGDRLRTLNFEAKRDGVHGLIAGGTGSGKSELLMTMIAGLALSYHPSILNFVLVDYKGGGAFGPFAGLPHCVDIITNLNESAVTRMFTDIEAELELRQWRNAGTGTAHIIEYRARGLHLTGEPYPHLFIIIDEYAEMITDNPEFKEKLDKITRVGRSLG